MNAVTTQNNLVQYLHNVNQTEVDLFYVCRYQYVFLEESASKHLRFRIILLTDFFIQERNSLGKDQENSGHKGHRRNLLHIDLQAILAETGN